MGTTGERLYRYAGGLMVRATPHAGLNLPDWPDLSGTTSAHVEAWQQWLREVRSLPGALEAITHASPDLAARIDAVCRTQTPPKAKRVRRIVLAVARYLLRMKYRPTPFGVFAGVAPARLGAASAMRWGDRHQVTVAANAGWLDAVINRLEDLPDVRDRLPVIANNAAEPRGDRLVLPHQPPTEKGGPVEVSLRLTGPLRVALESARTPVPFATLAEKVAAECGLDSLERVSRMLTDLLRHRVLISALRPASTTASPVDHVVTHLDRTGAADVPEAATVVEKLRAIGTVLDNRPASAGDRSRVQTAMSSLATVPSPLDLDMRVDCDVVLPEQVSWVAEEAAGLLTQLSAYPDGTDAWRAWHEQFVDRYGHGRLVPVVDVLDPATGLGFPAGYSGAATEPTARLHERDRRLLALAQEAALDRQRELVLDDQHRSDLIPSGEQRVPAHTELTLRVESASRSALDSGRFRIVVLGAARDAGAMTGRFERSLSEHTGLAARIGSKHDGLTPVQLSFPPLRPDDAHIARTPRLTEHLLAVSEHQPPGQGMIDLADLAVGCDDTGLYLVSYSLGQRIKPVVPHALNLRVHTPPLARFLAELPTATSTVLTGFDWGTATALPFLPRLRAGRIVLASARWRVTAHELPPRSAAWSAWVRSFEAWASRRGLPDEVELGGGDQRLRLDLGEQVHLMLLRSHLDATRTAVLTEAPAPGALGWCDGQPHEVVMPLTSVEGGSR